LCLGTNDNGGFEAGIQSGAVKGTSKRDNAVEFTLLREVLRESAPR
jgi:hypothetical protein